MLKPLLFNFLQWFRIKKGLPGFWGNFKTFDAAKAKAKGYGDPKVIAASAVKPDVNKHLTARDQQILAVVPVQCSTVLDVGGANGYYCHLIKTARPEVKCVVLETPEMVEASKLLAASWLSFRTDVADQYDLVIMSGVLQYFEEPLNYFNKYASKGKWILINRLPLIDAENRICVQQRADGGSYPAWFFSRKRFLEYIQLSHEIIKSWDVPQDSPMLDGYRRPYCGYLLKKRE